MDMCRTKFGVDPSISCSRHTCMMHISGTHGMLGCGDARVCWMLGCGMRDARDAGMRDARDAGMWDHGMLDAGCGMHGIVGMCGCMAIWGWGCGMHGMLGCGMAWIGSGMHGMLWQSGNRFAMGFQTLQKKCDLKFIPVLRSLPPLIAACHASSLSWCALSCCIFQPMQCGPDWPQLTATGPSIQ